MIELSVVIAVYGCRDCLRQLYERLCASLSSVTPSFEIVFVDDRSPDNAWEVLCELACRDTRVHALRLSRNFGEDAAITAGLSRSRGAWTAVMDCDLEEPPELVPRLYAKAHEGYEIVNTVRTGVPRSRLRRLASRLYWLVVLEPGARAEYSTLSLLSRKVVDAFLQLHDHEREFRLALDWLGFSRTTIEFELDPRSAGESSYTLRRLARVAARGMFFRTTVLLRWVVLLGFVIATAGAGLAIYVFADFFLHQQPRGYTSLAILVLFLVGFVIVAIGVVGLYVGRIFEQVRDRPLFVVDEELFQPELPSASTVIESARTTGSAYSQPHH